SHTPSHSGDFVPQTADPLRSIGEPSERRSIGQLDPGLGPPAQSEAGSPRPRGPLDGQSAGDRLETAGEGHDAAQFDESRDGVGGLEPGTHKTTSTIRETPRMAAFRTAVHEAATRMIKHAEVLFDHGSSTLRLQLVPERLGHLDLQVAI